MRPVVKPRAQASAASMASISGIAGVAMRVHRLVDVVGDFGEGDAPLEEGLDRDLVGGGHDGWIGPSGASGLLGQLEAGIAIEIGPGEVERSNRGEVERLDGRLQTLGVGERKLNRQFHVRIAQLGLDRAIAELDQ